MGIPVPTDNRQSGSAGWPRPWRGRDRRPGRCLNPPPAPVTPLPVPGLAAGPPADVSAQDRGFYRLTAAGKGLRPGCFDEYRRQPSLGL